jgi:hypothetical protein
MLVIIRQASYIFFIKKTAVPCVPFRNGAVSNVGNRTQLLVPFHVLQKLNHLFQMFVWQYVFKFMHMGVG